MLTPQQYASVVNSIAMNPTASGPGFYNPAPAPAPMDLRKSVPAAFITPPTAPTQVQRKPEVLQEATDSNNPFDLL